MAQRHARAVGKTINPSKYNYDFIKLRNAEERPDSGIDYVKASRELAAKQRYRKLQGIENAKPSFSQRHPVASALVVSLEKTTWCRETYFIRFG